MSAGFNLAEKEPFPEVFDTVWTDSKRGGGVEFMRIGETEGILHARSPYAVALPFICCGQFAGRLSPSVIKFGVIFFTQ